MLLLHLRAIRLELRLVAWLLPTKVTETRDVGSTIGQVTRHRLHSVDDSLGLGGAVLLCLMPLAIELKLLKDSCATTYFPASFLLEVLDQQSAGFRGAFNS